MVFLIAISDRLINSILEFLFQGHEFACAIATFVTLFCAEIYLRVFPGFIYKRCKISIRF